jgi:Arc/MetJ family transcription regulator
MMSKRESGKDKVGGGNMDKTIEISDDLVKAAQDATGTSDEREAVERAVKGFVEANRKKSALEGMLELAGSDILDPNYDYKAMRQGGGDDDHR